MWFNSLYGSGRSRRSGHSRPTPRFRPALEALDERRMLSAGLGDPLPLAPVVADTAVTQNEGATTEHVLVLEASGLRKHVNITPVNNGNIAVNTIPNGESSLGAWTGYVELLNTWGGSIKGKMTMTFATGDTLMLSFHQHYGAKDGSFGAFLGQFRIEGGTGAFMGASGKGSITASLLDTESVDVRILLEGTVQLSDGNGNTVDIARSEGGWCRGKKCLW